MVRVGHLDGLEADYTTTQHSAEQGDTVLERSVEAIGPTDELPAVSALVTAGSSRPAPPNFGEMGSFATQDVSIFRRPI